VRVIREELRRDQNAAGQSPTVPTPAVDSEPPADALYSLSTREPAASESSRFVNDAHAPARGDAGQNQAADLFTLDAAGPAPARRYDKMYWQSLEARVPASEGSRSSGEEGGG